MLHSFAIRGLVRNVNERYSIRRDEMNVVLKNVISIPNCSFRFKLQFIS